MPSWRITFDGTGQAVGDTLDEALYVPSADDVLPGFNATENTGTGGLLTLQNTFASEGSRGLRCETTASAAPFIQMTEDGTWGTSRWIVADIFIPTGALLPGNWDIFQPREASTLWRLRITSARIVGAIIPGASIPLITSASPLSFDTHYRLAFNMVTSPTTGEARFKIYAGNSSTPLETQQATGLNTGSVLTTNVRFGIPIAFGPAGPFYLDNVRGTDGAEPGPSGAAPGVFIGSPGRAKRWNGSAFVSQNKVKRWNGSAWVMVKPKPYD